MSGADHGEWVLPPQALPPSVAELERRIETATAVARSSEAAAIAIGEAALDAAEQARRAAELAERASAAVLGAVSGRGGLPPRPQPPAGPSGAGAHPGSGRVAAEEGLRDFLDRADRLSLRLRHIGAGPARRG
jgi:thiamine pyrophosphate-dependent acetolactate synthase large subunit-like protein